MKAQTFKIVGKPSLVKAMREDLESYGYSFNPMSKSIGYIFPDYINFTSKNDFLKLTIIESFDSKMETFALPEDYNKALDFAKEQLLDKYWVEEFKVGDYIIYAGYIHKILKNSGSHYVTSVKAKNGKIEEGSVYKENAIKATPAQIEEFNRIDWEKDDLAYSITLKKVLKISYVGICGIDSFDKGDIYYDVDVKSLIRPTLEQIEEFNKPVCKAGDWWISTHTHSSAFPKNYVFHIDKIEGKNIYTTNISGNKDIFQIGSDVEKNIKLATTEEIKKANEPKDGDIVVAILSEGGLKEANLGTLGKLNIGGYNYTVTDKTGKRICTNGRDFHPKYWRKATKEEIAEWNKPSWKDGDIVVLIDADSAIKDSTIVKIDTVCGDGSILFRDKKGKVGGSKKNPVIRLANAEELDKFNKKDYVEMTVGSRNAKIKVYKDKIYLLDTRVTLSLASLQKAYTNFIACSNIGDYSIQFSPNARNYQGYLVGCSSQNNLVSLNEIKAVLDAADKL